MTAYTYRGDKATRRAYLIEPGWPEPPPEHDPAPPTEPLTFARSGSAYGPTPLRADVDPEAWHRYENLPHTRYNPDDYTDPEKIRARWADPPDEPSAAA